MILRAQCLLAVGSLLLLSCEGTVGTDETSSEATERPDDDGATSGTDEESSEIPTDESPLTPDEPGNDPAAEAGTHEPPERDAASPLDPPAPDAAVDDPEPPPPVRFVVLGDGGTGDDHQHAVAAAVRDVCKQRGCEFALYAGDNIYESSVSGVDDAQFDSKFEQPYAELDFPFYVALGNHDYGSNGNNLLPDDAKSSAQVEYTAHSSKWNMPHHYYTFRAGPIQFFALDTNAIILDRFRTRGEQEEWLDDAMADSDAPWKVVFGHHPYISNGQHGNSTNDNLRSLIEGSVCGRAQVYFAGHDHNREWLEPVCGTSFIVSGAAAKLRDMRGDTQPTRFQDGKKRGFLWVEVTPETLTGSFYDDARNLDYEDLVLRWTAEIGSDAPARWTREQVAVLSSLGCHPLRPT